MANVVRVTGSSIMVGIPRLVRKGARVVRRFVNGRLSALELFQGFEYQRHNQRRLEHLASLGLDIAGRTVLEVGAGIGDHTSFFLDRNCTVVSTEARLEALRVLADRYPEIRVMALNLECPDPRFDEQFDIVYCYGLLYHLGNPEKAIEFMADHCRSLLLLETCVSFGDGELANLCPENSANATQSVSGTGCRPTRAYVYARLKRHFNFVYLPITQPNHEEFPVDWSSPLPEGRLSRAVFIASRSVLHNPLLVEEIPGKQRRRG